MQVIDLTDEHRSIYFDCLEDWSDEIKEAGDHKSVWYEKMSHRGLRVKLALDDAGTVGGMIQYVPSEYTLVEGDGLYFICCIWVHGHKKGRGNFQKRGMGKAMLQAAEDDVRELGARGIAAWGLSLPFWMKASWFNKQGYEKVDKDGISVLLWKPFADDITPPKWIRKRKEPETVPDKVTVTALKNGWCTGQNMVFERARKASDELGDKVLFRAIDTSEKAILHEWGMEDALFIDGKQVRTGPPPSYEKIRKLIARQVKRLP